MTGPRLANRTEDIVTEALTHVLNSSQESRQALGGFLLACDANIGEISKVVTQAGWRGWGKPDMSCRDSNNEERLLIEAKFGAYLTENQPITYLRRLPKDKPSALLFAVPPGRLKEIWEELRNRVSRSDDLELHNEKSDPEIRWGDVGGHRKLIATSWRFLLDYIAAQATSAVAQTVNDLHQLQGMVELRSFEQLRNSSLPLGFPRSLPHMYTLIDNTIDRLVEKGLAEIPTGAYRPTVTSVYSVRYFTFCGLTSCSLGIYFGDWRTYHHSPLWFTLHHDGLDESVVEVLRNQPFVGLMRGTHLYIPIHLQGQDYETMLDAIMEQIVRIANLLKPIR